MEFQSLINLWKLTNTLALTMMRFMRRTAIVMTAKKPFILFFCIKLHKNDTGVDC